MLKKLMSLCMVDGDFKMVVLWLLSKERFVVFDVGNL